MTKPPTTSSDSPILERAVIPPRPQPRSRRLAIVAASLGALGLAAAVGVVLGGRGSTAQVDVRIDLPTPPAVATPAPAAPSPLVATARSATAGWIQVALLLDTSGSMGGLIDQARAQLWKIVTRLDAAQRDGKPPVIEIALYEYGNQRASASSGWIRQITPFTSDLDRVSEALFALSVDGGEEYVGQAVSTAVSDLQWSTREGDLRLVFVAGNESFDQGPVAPARAMERARAKGISVTAILCGTDDPSWKNGTKRAHMGYFEIDSNATIADIAAPQDAEIVRLGDALNATYIPFGAAGNDGLARQAAQDSNAAHSQPGSVVWRSIAKSTGNYDNDSWDLGDHLRNGAGLAAVSEADLPEVMRGMTAEQRTRYVEQKLAERSRLSQRIQRLGDERGRFLAAARRDTVGESLDSAMLRAVAALARAAGFEVH